MTTLGEKLHNTIKRIEAENAAIELDRQFRENVKERNRRADVSRWLTDFLDECVKAINAGLKPKSKKIPERFGNGMSWPISENISNPLHRDFDLWVTIIDSWAKYENLNVECVSEHDGMGIQSWWTIYCLSSYDDS